MLTCRRAWARRSLVVSYIVSCFWLPGLFWCDHRSERCTTGTSFVETAPRSVYEFSHAAESGSEASDRWWKSASTKADCIRLSSASSVLSVALESSSTVFEELFGILYRGSKPCSWPARVSIAVLRFIYVAIYSISSPSRLGVQVCALSRPPMIGVCVRSRFVCA